MSWIKRNLFMVVGGVISLALLGAAGFFLYTKYEANRPSVRSWTRTSRT